MTLDSIHNFIITYDFYIIYLLILCAYARMFFLVHNKLNKENTYSIYLNILILLSSVFLLIFISKMFQIEPKYIPFASSITTKEELIAGTGIAISALLAGISMLYQMENSLIEKKQENQIKEIEEKNILKNLLEKIILALESELETYDNVSTERLTSTCKASNITVQIITNDLQKISNYYKYIDDFKELITAEKRILTFKHEINGTEQYLVSLKSSLSDCKSAVENIRNLI